MKKLLFIFTVAFIAFLSSCKKEEIDTSLPAKDVKQALARIEAVSKWKVKEITKNGVLEYKDGVTYNNADNSGLAEWLTFNASNSTCQVKSLDEAVPETFSYVINTQNQTLVVKDADGYEDFLIIESGNVYTDHFDLSQTLDQTTWKVKLIPF
jgi:hypothetical protein